MHINNLLKLNVHFYLISVTTFVAVAGDYLVKSSNNNLLKAFLDNSTHAIIGGLSWSIVCVCQKNLYALQTLLEICLCTLVSSLIDLDHFIEAKSYNLIEATNLYNRPFLHCSSVPLVIILPLLFVAFIFELNLIKRFLLIIFTAFATHHTRDATRRGYWLYPFGSTPPVPYLVYIAITVLIPYFVGFSFSSFKMKKLYDSSIDV